MKWILALLITGIISISSLGQTATTAPAQTLEL